MAGSEPGGRMLNSKLARAAGALMLMVAVGGCSFQTQLERIAIDQNQVVATTTDSLTLLNIMRASKWRPLHFTSISRISGNVDLNAQGSLGGGVSISGEDSASLAPGASVGLSTQPNFDMMIHDSQDFQRGIMQPISAEIINYYLHTGWRADLLTYLLVERIDFVAEQSIEVGGRIYKAGESIETLQNDPSDARAAQQFHNFVSCYTLSASRRPGDTLPIKKFSEMSVSLGDLSLLDGSKFDLGNGPDYKSNGQGKGDDWVVRKIAGGDAVGLSRAVGSDCSSQSVLLIDGNSVRAKIDPLVATIDPRKTRTFDVIIAGRELPVRTSIDITFRSVDGVIYFLGEYLRGSDETRQSYAIANRSGGSITFEPLLRIEPGRGGRYDLRAELDGQSVHVPIDCKCRSYQVIALIEQLFNLHKAGSAAPLTTAVRVLN